jgi:hypothetical protein
MDRRRIEVGGGEHAMRDGRLPEVHRLHLRRGEHHGAGGHGRDAELAYESGD